MSKVQACKACGIAVERNFVNEKTNTKTSLPVDKCPICSGDLVEDDSENYY